MEEDVVVEVYMDNVTLSIAGIEGMASECYATGIQISYDKKIVSFCFDDKDYASEFAMLVELHRPAKRRTRKKGT